MPVSDAGKDTVDAQRAALEDQLEFERFLAELSYAFINVPAEQIDDAIRDGLRRMGQQLRLERCSFFRVGADSVLSNPVIWTAPGIPAVESPIDAGRRFPWAVGRLLAGDTVAFSTVAEIPSDVDRVSFRELGTKSGLFVPLSVEGIVSGALGFNTISSERAWSDENRHQVHTVASVFGQVLARQLRDRCENLKAS